MENNDRPTGTLLSGKDTRIQLVVNRPENASSAVDLGRIFRNMKAKTRIFAWVLVLCLVVGIAAPLLMYQLEKKTQSVASVVTLRYNVPAQVEADGEETSAAASPGEPVRMVPVTLLQTPTGEDLDLSMVTASSVLKEAVGNLTLSAPVSLDNLRSNITVTRVLTEESSRTKEALAGLADAKTSSAYERLESTEIRYQNRFVVSLANGFGDADSGKKAELTAEELQIVLNRILDAYNTYLVKQYADVRLPEDMVSAINTGTQDFPEIVSSLNTALDELYAYCEGREESVRAYRSWQTGMTLNDWMERIRTIQAVCVEYLDADLYSRGQMRDRNTVILNLRYRLRTLQADLDKVSKTIENNAALLKNYRNNEVLVSMQESDTARSTTKTTDFYKRLVLQQADAFAQAASLRTGIAEAQNKIDRLNGGTASGEIADTEADVMNALETVRDIQAGIRTHMAELFASPLYTTYSEHSAPQGDAEKSFLAASSAKMAVGGIAGVLIACVIWFVSALVQELKQAREDNGPKAEADGKEAAEA